MRTYTHLLAATALLLCAAPARAQDPDIPLAPREMSLCDRLDAQWQALHQNLVARHDSCLETARQGRQCSLDSPDGQQCDCAPCESLHQERDRVAAERSSTVRECRMTVREYQEEVRRREAEERRRQQELERQRQEEENRLREEAEARRRQAEQEAREREAQERADEQARAEEEAEQRREDQEAERRRAAEEAERRTQEERDREAAEEARREQMERDQRMIAQAADLAALEHEAMEQRNAQREQAVEQMSRQNGMAAQQSDRTAGSIAEQAAGAIGRLAEETVAAVGSSASGGSVDDFAFEAAEPDEGTDFTGMAIDGLVDLGKTMVPFAAVPLEMIRGVMQQNSRTIDAIASAIQNVETTDGSELEAAIDGYRKVLSPATYIRVLAEEAAVDEAPESIAQALSQTVQAHLTERLDAFRSRLARGFLDTEPAEGRSYWVAGDDDGDGDHAPAFLPIVEQTASELADAAGNWLVGKLVGAAAEAWEGTP
jgi:hypothetical protein